MTQLPLFSELGFWISVWVTNKLVRKHLKETEELIRKSRQTRSPAETCRHEISKPI